MKKQMKRTVYEAPVTERFSVELEGDFMAGSADIQNPNTNTGKIDSHDVNTEFGEGKGDFADDFSIDGWV